MSRRKVCVVTGTRAEYGLLYPILKEIESREELLLQLVVTTAHLSDEFGSTYKQIEKDGFKINKKVEVILSTDTPSSICKSTGLGIIGFGRIGMAVSTRAQSFGMSVIYNNGINIRNIKTIFNN